MGWVLYKYKWIEYGLPDGRPYSILKYIYMYVYAHPSPFRGEGWAILIYFKRKKKIYNIYLKRKKRIFSEI